MIKAEFGIVEEIEYGKNYSEYKPEEFDCVVIDDDIYLNDWWDRLCEMKTYFHSTDRAKTGLARWGVTLIPPESLLTFKNIVIDDPHICNDNQLIALADKIEIAIHENKFMIHFGV